MRLSLLSAAALLSASLLDGAVATAQSGAACDNPTAECGAVIQSACLRSVGAGSLPVDEGLCRSQFDEYRDCIAGVAERCGATAGDGAEVEDVAEAAPASPKPQRGAEITAAEARACAGDARRHRVIGVDPTDVLNARAGPGASNPKLYEIPFDADDVYVQSCESTPQSRYLWCRIVYDCQFAWVSSRYIVAAGDSVPPEERMRSFRVVGVESWDVLKIRARPDGDSAEIGAIAPDARNIPVFECVDVAGWREPWCKVSWDGVEGWAYARFLEEDR